MKNNFLKLVLGAGLAVLPFAGGCLPQNNGQPATVESAALAEPVVYEAQPASPEPIEQTGGNNEVAQAPAVDDQADAPPLEQLAVAPVQPLSTNQPLPGKVSLSAPAVELVRLAGSGVDQSVMLAYVTNSPGLFNLKAEEIIFLNDLGISAPVVTAMIQRDQALKASGTAALLSQSAPVTSVPAPTASVPDPVDVAPQPANAPLTPPADYATEPPPAAPAEEASYATFGDALAPYGSWVYVAGYGRCWRPSAVAINPNWQPYFDGGHWAYTDYGWYWMSDYSWGWAPFHYGRWFRHHNWGWCWAPGTVWGPSWVAWRQNADYCGWAPLPPGAYFSFSIGLTFHGHPVHHWDECGLGPNHYRFVAWRSFDQHHLHEHAVPYGRNTQIYNTTVVNNHYTVRNNTVVNQGVTRERVVAATHRDMKPLSVRPTSTPVSNPLGARGEQLSGNTLTVYRPPVAKPSTTLTKPGTLAGPTKPNTVTGATKPAPAVSANYTKPAIGANTTTPGTRFSPGKPSGNTLAGDKAPTVSGNASVTKPGVQASQTQPNSSSYKPATAPATKPGSTVGPNPAAPRQYIAPPNYQQPGAKPAPQTPPGAQYYSGPQRSADVPRYAPTTPNNSQALPRYSVNPTYSAPRTYAPPTYSRPDSTQVKPSAPANEVPRSAAPAASAPRAPSADPRPAPAPPSGGKSQGNGGGNGGNGGRSQ